jgi:hypothetical protein
MEGTRNAYIIILRKIGIKYLLGRSRGRWASNVHRGVKLQVGEVDGNGLGLCSVAMNVQLLLPALCHNYTALTRPSVGLNVTLQGRLGTVTV